MSKVKQDGVVYNVDADNNPVIKTIIVEKTVVVPDITAPQTNRVTPVSSGIEKTALTLFSKREEITLTGTWQYLGNVSFTASKYHDAVSEFTAVVEYIIEAESANSRAMLKLFSYSDKVIVAGSEIDTGEIDTGKISLESGTLTMPESGIVEVWGRKDAGSVSFLSAKIDIEKKRKDGV